MENQGKKQNKFVNRLLGLPDNVLIKFDPNDNTLLSSNFIDDKGNSNIFRIIIDKNEPFLRQRINGNEYIIH